MAATREQIAKQLLSNHVASKPTGAKPHRPTNRRVRHPRRLPSPTAEELEQREQGWNGRFVRDPPSETRRPNRAKREVDQAAASMAGDTKERKIREERQQYGHGDVARASHNQRPGANKLVPIAGNLPPPPRELDTTSSKEEKLRFKVFKAIDVRETLIYQLNALILCTPVQEALVLAASRATTDGAAAGSQLKPRSKMALATDLGSGGSVGVMTNAREAVRLAQQLASDLQTVGIQVVEGLVEWMLEAGAKAEKPPEFTWRGRNYFLKMESDLDFAGPELRARGVDLDCFSVNNALCVRPDQKLGRVLAARSIINEMVEMACQVQTATQLEQPKTSARKLKTTPRSVRQQSPTTRSPHNDKAATQSSPRPMNTGASADEMILATDRYDDDQYEAVSVRASTAIQGNTQLPTLQRDEATEQELMSMLEDSIAVDEPIKPSSSDPPPPEPSTTVAVSARSSARDEYDNSFEEEEATVNTPRSNAAVDNTEDRPLPQDEPAQSDHTPEPMEDELAPTPAVNLISHHDNLWRDVVTILDVEDTAESTARLQRCAEWMITEKDRFQVAVEKTLDGGSWVAVLDLLDDSMLSLLPSTPAMLDSVLSRLVSDPSPTSLQLPVQLWEQSHCIVDSACSVIARTLQHRIEHMNPLVSEVDLDDILQDADAVLQARDVKAVMQRVHIVTQVMRVCVQARQGPSVSPGFSALVQVFYPYIVNQPRDRLPSSWRRVKQLLIDTTSIDVDQVHILLNPQCKVLMLNAVYLARCQEHDDSIEISKLTIVCSRGRVLESSVDAVYTTCLGPTEARLLPSYHLFPFFESSFGEKTVDGVRVEEGEGKGPLKEWFTLVAQELATKWRPLAMPVRDANEFDPVIVNGSKLVVDGLAQGLLQPGYKLEWRSPADEAVIVSRIINKCDPASGSYLLDRGSLSNQSFQLAELQVWQPRVAILEYIQSSESYWLNEAVADTPANRKTLAFVGWFIANALVHQCALQLRLHRLLFELLLRHTGSDRISMEDLKALNPSLHSALMQMKHMKPAEFASYLEFEGLPTSLSVDEYIARTLDDKFGAKSNVSWQLQELRRGFRRVFSDELLQQVRLSAADLMEQLAGDAPSSSSSSGASSTEFAIDKVFRLSLDPDFAKCGPLQRAFWRAVESFDGAMKRRLIKFITGVDTLPQPGTEFLRIEMPFGATTPLELDKTLRMLPQSHTCDNTLELPHYWRALCWKAKHDADKPDDRLQAELETLLAQKLRVAADYSSGYGLDGTSSSSLAGILPHTGGAAQLSAQDSYDSLDLPALGEGSSGGGLEEVRSIDPETTDVGRRGGDEPLVVPSSPARADDEYGADDWEEEELAE